MCGANIRRHLFTFGGLLARRSCCAADVMRRGLAGRVFGMSSSADMPPAMTVDIVVQSKMR